MESMIDTTRETNEIDSEPQDVDLMVYVLFLKQKILYLEKELKHTKENVMKLEKKNSQHSRDLANQRYQIYFRHPKTRDQVT